MSKTIAYRLQEVKAAGAGVFHHQPLLGCPRCGKSLQRYNGVEICWEKQDGQNSAGILTSVDDKGHLRRVTAASKSGAVKVYCGSCYDLLTGRPGIGVAAIEVDEADTPDDTIRQRDKMIRAYAMLAFAVDTARKYGDVDPAPILFDIAEGIGVIIGMPGSAVRAILDSTQPPLPGGTASDERP